MFNHQIPWGFRHRPGPRGKYGISIRFYFNRKWHSRNLGRFQDAQEAIKEGNAEARRRGFIRQPAEPPSQFPQW